MKTRWISMLFAAFALLAAAPLAAGTKDDLIRAHGADRFDVVREVSFTFSVTRDGKKTSRHWTWAPKSGDVTLRYTDADGNEQTVSYRQSDVDENADKSIIDADKKFVNDTFWLAWPLHLTWCADVSVEDTGVKTNPLTGKDTPSATIRYPSEGGGYTPGDMYVLYLGPDNRPVAWSFHRGGAEEPTLTCSWEKYQPAGPLVLATDHWNADKSFRLQIEDLSVAGEKDDSR